ncbi:MAG TPA: DEAD/DEAH box helicase [Streptosporangiaceae bacterium]|nr:DEAD/DEAH box helicase [Streptosporangiaceae bacterium]
MSQSSGGAAALSITSMLQSATDEDLRGFISEPVRDLLTTVDPGSLEGQRLRDLLGVLWTGPEILRDGFLRARLIALLPLARARELARALEIPDGPDGAEALAALDLSGRRAQEALARFFGVVQPPRAAQVLTRASAVATASHGLFPHQRVVVRDLLAALREPPRRVVLHLPTGAGKTRVAMNVVCDHLRSHDPGVVMWLAYSRELLEQAASAFESAWGALGNRDLAIVRYWGDTDTDLVQVTDGIIIAGLGKLDALAGRDYQVAARLADRTALTVMDEAHQSIAHTYRQLLELLATKRPDAGLLGLTATPGRTWADIESDAELAAFFRHRKVTLHPEGYTNPVTFLIDQGYLARPSFVTLNVDAGLSLSDADLRALSSSLEVPSDLLRKLADDQQRTLRILDAVENLLEHHRRAIVFATTVEHARLLAAVLRARGHAAEAITAGTPWADRESAIQRYRSNTPAPMVLCNYGVLTAGFDAPSTSAAVIARPTRSLVLYSQMAGRAIRGPKAGGNEHAEIVTVVDLDLPGFGEITDAFTNWEDVWG